MGGSSSVNTMPMATGKLSASPQSSTPPIGYNPAQQVNPQAQPQARQGLTLDMGGASQNLGGASQNAISNSTPQPQAQPQPNWRGFLSGQGPLLEEGQTYQMTPDQMRRQQIRDQINQNALTQPVMRTFTPPQRQATGKGPATPQNDPYFRNEPVYGSFNPGSYRSFQNVPAPRPPGYDWARIIASSLFPQDYTRTGTGGGTYGGGYGGAGGGTQTGISGRNDGGNTVERADGGRVEDMSPEEILELARKIISERG